MLKIVWSVSGYHANITSGREDMHLKGLPVTKHLMAHIGHKSIVLSFDIINSSHFIKRNANLTE